MSSPRNWILALAISLTTSFSTLFAQTSIPPASPPDLPTVEHLIELHLNSLGGKRALESVKTMVTHATMTVETPFGNVEMNIFSQQAGTKMLMVTTSNKFEDIKLGSNGETAWSDDPFVGKKILEGDEKTMMLEQQGSIFPGLAWSHYEGKITVKSKTTIDDSDCFEVEFAPKSGPSTTRFFDAKTGHIRQIIATAPGARGLARVRLVPSDYRKVDGITIPFKQTTFIPNPESGKDMEMVMRITKIKINPKIDDSVFELPENIKKLLK